MVDLACGHGLAAALLLILDDHLAAALEHHARAVGALDDDDLVDLGVEHEVLQKSGTWISFGDERIGQGKENARRFLKENTDLRDRLTEQVYASRGLKLPVLANAGASEVPLEEVVE